MNTCVKCGKTKENLKLSKSGYCMKCANQILDERKREASANRAPSVAYAATEQAVSKKDWLATLLLNLFLGLLGAHRFYVGKVGTGIVWLITLGCFGFGALIDFILILVGKFTDITGALVLSDSQKSNYGVKPSADQPYQAAQSSGDYVDQLQKLAQLFECGAITEIEYNEKKAVLLSKIG